MPLLSGQRLAILDIETTGWRPRDGSTLLEVAHVDLENGAIGESWSTLVGPRRSVPSDVVRLTGITEAMLSRAPDPAVVAARLSTDCAGRVLVFHNARFDLPFIAALLAAARVAPLHGPVVDTLGLARGLFGGGGNTLSELAEKLGLPVETFHRALPDARATAHLLLALAPRWEAERGIGSLDELAAASQDAVRDAARRAAALRRAAMALGGLGTPRMPDPEDTSVDSVEDAETIISLDRTDSPSAHLEASMHAAVTLDVGQEAPDFQLKGPGGQPVTLSEFRGNKNVVLVFYPLAFSPICSHQLPALSHTLAEFEKLDAVVFGISVDSHHSNTAFAKQLGIAFPLLSDFHRRTSAAYGVLDEARATSGRALFVIDKRGIVIHREISAVVQDMAQVPSAERALEVLRAAG